MKSGKSFIQILIFTFPLLLIAMVIVGIALYEQRRVDKQEEHPMSQRVTIQGMIGQSTKLREFMSPRGLKTEEEIQKLKMTTAFIDGSLSPVNIGMVVNKETKLTEAGLLWKEYQIEYEGKGQSKSLHINYLTASDAELAIGLAIAEALPQQALRHGLTISFGPTGENSLINDWVTTAKTDSALSSFYEDGIDWKFLTDKTAAYLQSL